MVIWSATPAATTFAVVEINSLAVALFSEVLTPVLLTSAALILTGIAVARRG